MTHKKGARSDNFRLCTVASCASNSGHDMQSQTEEGKARAENGTSMVDQGKPQRRTDNCRSGPEQTNYKAGQRRQFRTSQDQDHDMNRTLLRDGASHSSWRQKPEA